MASMLYFNNTSPCYVQKVTSKMISIKKEVWLNTNAKQETIPLREDDDSVVRTFQKSRPIHNQMRQFTAIRFNFTLQLNLLRLLDIRNLELTVLVLVDRAVVRVRMRVRVKRASPTEITPCTILDKRFPIKYTITMLFMLNSPQKIQPLVLCLS